MLQITVLPAKEREGAITGGKSRWPDRRRRQLFIDSKIRWQYARLLGSHRWLSRYLQTLGSGRHRSSVCAQPSERPGDQRREFS